MAADVVVARGKDTWTIAGTSLAPLISFSTAADGSITPVFDEAGLDPLLKKLAKKVDRPAQGRGPQAGRADTSSPPAPATRAGRSTLTGMKAAIISEIAGPPGGRGGIAGRGRRQGRRPRS